MTAADAGSAVRREHAGAAARHAATALLAGVLDHRRPLDGLLDPSGGEPLFLRMTPRDRALARAIVGTALRRHGEIGQALDRLIERPLPRRAGPLRRIIEVAAAQILFMEVPDRAAVSVAVDAAAGDPAARHFKGLANAVLRRLARERDAILPTLDRRLNTPRWLLDRWTAAHGEADAARIAAAHAIEAPLDLSVKADPVMWAERLGATPLPNGSLRLRPGGPVDALPGFAEGAWWVQDAAAALPARLLGAGPGTRVADLCAAPGGKTAELAVLGAEVTAVDVSASRIERLKGNLDRLGLAAATVVADIARWEPGESFDAVLLDAPCSSTGTIRRHPDVAWLKSEADIAALAALQRRLLERAVALTRPGGVLVYCTCSLEPEEGEAQIAAALAGLPVEPVPIDPGETGGLGRKAADGALRTMPFDLDLGDPRLSGLGGFFIARLRRR